MAIFFELITDGTNTHYVFEKFARNFVYDKMNKARLINKAKIIFDELKRTVKSIDTRPERFARIVYIKAVLNVPKVKNNDRSTWTEAVCDAIPLAIGATAVILEPWK